MVENLKPMVEKAHVMLKVACFCSLCGVASGAEVFTVTPTDDAFVRAAEPTLNYGAAGALAIAGPDAVNGAGQPQGRFDSVLRFDTSDAIEAFNSAYGAGAWTINSVQLAVTEVGAPNQLIFNRGVGDFELFWLSDDSWIEGPGKPGNPPVGTGDEITWDLLQTILGSSTEASVGVFANDGTNDRRTYPLGMDGAFVADLAAGGPVSFHAAPVSSMIGFTFNSGNYLIPEDRPELIITAIPEPATTILLTVGGMIMMSTCGRVRRRGIR